MKTYGMRLLTIVVMFFVLILSGHVTAQASAVAIVSVQTPASAPLVGSSFDVLVNIGSVSDLFSYQFDLSFNPAVISATGMSEGPFLATGGSTMFLPGSIDNVAGTIAFTANSLVGEVPGINGAGTLVTINFQALASGSSSMDLSNVILLNSSFSDIPFVTIAGTVSPSAVPLPSSLWLIGPGLMGLIGLKRKYLG